MKRRTFLAMGVLVLGTGCVGLGSGFSGSFPVDGTLPLQQGGEGLDGSSLGTGVNRRRSLERHLAIHRRFLERARKRRLERQARSRRRRPRGSGSTAKRSDLGSPPLEPHRQRRCVPGFLANPPSHPLPFRKT